MNNEIFSKEIIYDNTKTIYFSILVLASFILSKQQCIIELIKSHILYLEIFVVLIFFIAFFIALKFSSFKKEKLKECISLTENIMIMNTFSLSLYPLVSANTFYFLTTLGYLSILSLSFTAGILTELIIKILREKIYDNKLSIKSLFITIYFCLIYWLNNYISNTENNNNLVLKEPYMLTLLLCIFIYFLITLLSNNKVRLLINEIYKS